MNTEAQKMVLEQFRLVQTFGTRKMIARLSQKSASKILKVKKIFKKIEKEILIDWQFLAEKDVYIPPDLAFAGLCIPRNENSNYPLKVDFAIID